MSKKYQLTAVGGTFDHFHLGHEQLLNTAFDVSEKVVIGLTKPVLYQHKILATEIKSFPKRKNQLLKYLSLHHFQSRSIIVPLTDPYGPALTNPKIDAIVVSKQTLLGAKALNQKRLHLGLQSLPVVVTDMVTDDRGEHLSSTSIRQGLTATSGLTYSRILDRGLFPSDTLRNFLSHPYGPIYTVPPTALINAVFARHLPVIAVGDQVSQICANIELPLTHLIYDSYIQRQPIQPDYLTKFPYPKLKVINPSGQISQSALLAVKNLIDKKRGILAVTGEEDLLVIPVLLLAPLGSLILYGQPNQGMVVVKVNSSTKLRLYNKIIKSQT